MPPVVKRRRTRSRRTTRRLHRTRRQRGQRGGDAPVKKGRMDLTAWIGHAKPKRSIDGAKDTMDIMQSLKDDVNLTLTPETAPDISSFTKGKTAATSESPLGGTPEKTGQTLLSAIANIYLQTGDEVFANPTIFREKMILLKNLPADEFGQGKELYQFIEELETYLQESKTPVDITNPDNYPLYIWFAVANFDRSKSEDYSTPLMEEPPVLIEPTLAAPAQPGE